VDAGNSGNIVVLSRPGDLNAGQLRGIAMNRTTTIAISGGLALAALAFCADSGFAQSGSGNNNGATNTSGVIIGGNGNSGNNIQQSRQTQTNRQSYSGYQGIDGTGNSNITTNSGDPGRTVPNVFAPGLAAAGSEVCLGSVSGGGSGSGFGLTIGGTFVDRECQLRLNARTLATLGYPVAARETMCLDEDVRRAMYAAGTPCAGDRAGWAGYGGWASAQPSTQVAAAPASHPALASQPAPASQSVATSQSESTSDPKCSTPFGAWFNRCSDGREQVSDATPALTATPEKKLTVTARAKPATQSKEAKAKQQAHEAAATPTTEVRLPAATTARSDGS
jgi:hypothetical protein